MTTTDELLEQMSVACRDEWEKIVEPFISSTQGQGFLTSASRTADNLCMDYAMIAEYLTRRGWGFNHESAVHKAKRAGNKIAKELGYNKQW